MRVFLNWLYNVLNAVSQLLNTVFLLGDPDESISGVIGKSIERGGWASRVPMPRWLRNHFTASIEDDRGQNTAFRRQYRP